MVHNEDLNVNYLDMPTTVHGRTVPNEDGTYSVFINSRLSHDGQLNAYNEEVKHINRGDFDSDCEKSVQQIECEAHGLEYNHSKPVRKQRGKNRKKWAAITRKCKFLESIGHDFMADAESRYLDPEC